MHALRPYIEKVCDQMEATLAAYRAPGRITGGTASGERIQLFFTPAPHTRTATVLALLPILSAAIHAPVDGQRGEAGVILTFKPVEAFPECRQLQAALEVHHERQAD